jgi:hypothetical protein
VLFVIDLETTGLNPQNACVWELGAVALQNGAIANEFHTRVCPELRFFRAEHRRVAREVCGLDDAELLALLDAPSVTEARQAFLSWACRVLDVPYPCDQTAWKTTVERATLRVTSYNQGFDGEFFRTMPWQVDFFAQAQAPLEWVWALCVMEATTQAMGEKGLLPAGKSSRWRYPKLSFACEHYGVSLTDAHSALADARAAAELAVKLGVT